MRHRTSAHIMEIGIPKDYPMLPSANPTDDPLELLPLGPKAQFYGLWLIAAVATTLLWSG